jgi:serine/threonine protein kinase
MSNSTGKQVYIGVNLDSGIYMAIKEISFSGAQDTQALLQNFEILKRLHHPNLCQYYGVEVFSDRLDVLSMSGFFLSYSHLDII